MPAVTDVPGISVGTWEDTRAMTGCTVILTENGAVGGVDVRGGAPGTRETDLLSPLNTVEKVNAVLLAGGSAFGLAAAGGVMRYLEERGKGHPVGPTVVPIVPAAVLYDLSVGSHEVRPQENNGYEACLNASSDVKEGNYGAGCGATVGKIRGYGNCTKSGQGTWSLTLPGDVIVGALVAVNAFGDVLDPDDRRCILAGVRDDNGRIIGTMAAMRDILKPSFPPYGTNTTIAVVATNARLTKAQCTKVAGMAHNGLARVIFPVHTPFDGDTVFVLATGEKDADLTTVGIAAGEALAQAVVRAVKAARDLGGIKAAGNSPGWEELVCC